MPIYRNAERYAESLITLVLNLNPVPSPRGSFGGLSPQTKLQVLQAAQNWNTKHYKSVGFLSILECLATPYKQMQSPPIENFLAMVLPKPRRQRQTIIIMKVFVALLGS